MTKATTISSNERNRVSNYILDLSVVAARYIAETRGMMDQGKFRDHAGRAILVKGASMRLRYKTLL
jgi:hypothetical protein